MNDDSLPAWGSVRFGRVRQGHVLDSEESVSSWIRQLQQGDQQAAQRLWGRYGDALQKIARSRYRSALNAVFDEQDLAQSVFLALWKTAEAGRLASVQDRNELWWLLLEITRRRAMARMTYNNASKRKNSAAATPGSTGASETVDPLSQLSDPRQLSPEVLTILDEEHGHFMDLLPDDLMHTIALLHLEGYSNEEIAQKVDFSQRTVSRKLKLIRDIWIKELNSRQP